VRRGAAAIFLANIENEQASWWHRDGGLAGVATAANACGGGSVEQRHAVRVTRRRRINAHQANVARADWRQKIAARWLAARKHETRWRRSCGSLHATSRGNRHWHDGETWHRVSGDVTSMATGGVKTRA
jgi:hypothetical protein